MKNPEQKIFYTSGLIVLAILLLIVFGIIPLLNRIKGASSNFVQNQIAIENLYIDWLSLQVSAKELSKIDQEKLERSFLDPDRTLNFILTLEEIVKKANLWHEIKVFTLSSAAGQTKELTNTIPFQITLLGRFPDFIHFLNYFENMPYYAEIDSMQIQRISKETLGAERTSNLTEGDIKATLNIKTYVKN